MTKKKFDLDHFIVELETDEELAMYELSNKQRDRKQTYRACPRCGSHSWQQIYYNDIGKASCCNECENAGQ